MFQFNNESGLVGFGSFGNGKGVAERQVKYFERNFHNEQG
jgi:hypothetical protein